MATQHLDTPEAIGVLVAERRRALGLRQVDVALAAGTGDRFVRDLEHGKATCHIGPTLRVLAVLGVRLVGGAAT